MAKIEPFQAFVYNPDRIPRIASVVCPPYDVISAKQQDYYHSLSHHNFIRILLGKDIAGEDKYRRAARIFKEWQEKGVFVQEKKPAIYFYSQEYTLRGEKKTRLGFIARLYLDQKNPAVFAHEHTRRAPKLDRLRLLRRVKANLSPIFALFMDKKRLIQSAYRYCLQKGRPFIDIVDTEKVAHKLWRIDSPELLEAIRKNMHSENIFIADGHHRYEVSCIYRDQMLKKLGGADREAPFNYTLAYFTNTDSSGLSILPIHRLVKLPSPLNMDQFIASASGYFEITPVKDKTRFFFLMEKGARQEHLIGMYYRKNFWLLRLKSARALDKAISNEPRELKGLDVSILNHLILSDILGIDGNHGEEVSFGPHADELIAAVDKSPRRAAFLLNPVKVEQIISAALAGKRMPPKSTYFYPKVLSGLAINKH